MLSKLLHLKDGELPRLWPFFTLYLILFSALTLSDGLSLALFVQRVGVGHLPFAYGAIAVLNLAAVVFYFFRAENAGSTRVFFHILLSTFATFFMAWSLVVPLELPEFGYVLLYLGREISATMILLHFGTYLQDYFTRDELNRVLPIVYAGGRLGGIFGAAALENISGFLGLNQLILLAAGLSLFALLGVGLISRRVKPAPDDVVTSTYPIGASPVAAAKATSPLVTNTNSPPVPNEAEKAAATTLRGFLRYVWENRLLFWITCTALLFGICRWILNYQYNSFFEEYFTENEFQSLVEIFSETTGGTRRKAIDMAQFLGRYTQFALAASMILQLFVVGRLISRLGAFATHMIYSVLLAAALTGSLLGLTLSLAVFARFVENELRFGLRNPVMQLITNVFTKSVRARVRAWTVGVLVPAATLFASILLWGLAQQTTVFVAWTGFAIGAFYLFAVRKMGRSFNKRLRREAQQKAVTT